MLRDVVIHLHNEQPILADLVEDPTPGDICLICTNLRTTSGTAPVFVERGDSTFVFPLAHIRFVEIRASSFQAPDALPALPEPSANRASGNRRGKAARSVDQTTLEDEIVTDSASPLERLGWVSGEAAAPPAERAPQVPEAPETDGSELLRRVREA